MRTGKRQVYATTGIDRRMIKNQIFKFRETARRQPEIRIRSGAGAKKARTSGI
jgi:hypothetical protein